jgi:hypothetical protein
MTRDELDNRLRALINEYRPDGWCRACVLVTPFDARGEGDNRNQDYLSVLPVRFTKSQPPSPTDTAAMLGVVREWVKQHYPDCEYASVIVQIRQGIPSVVLPVDPNPHRRLWGWHIG